MTNTRSGWRWAAILSAAVLAACSSSYGGTTGPGGTPPAGGHSTTIIASGSAAGGSNQYTFSPTPDTVAAGTQVTFTFQDVAHTVTFDSEPTALANIPATASADSVRTFSAAGTYTWHCSIHPYMHGTLVAK